MIVSFDSRILEFMVNSITARCPGPVAAKQIPIITRGQHARQLASDICADVLCSVFAVVAKHLYSSRLVVQIQPCKPKQCCHLRFREQRLSSSSSSKQVIFFSTASFASLISKHCTV